MIRRPPRSTRTDTLFPTRRSSDLDDRLRRQPHLDARRFRGARLRDRNVGSRTCARDPDDPPAPLADRLGREHMFDRSEEHTSELQSLMRISYAVFCLKKKNNESNNTN